jgi:hypothetical protein
VSTPITAAERHKRMPARGHAASFVLGAARIEAEEADDWRDSSLAEGYRAQALAPLSGEMIVHGAGGELVPRDSGKGVAEWRLLNTVENPNYVTADGSRGRLDLAQEAGALGEALDAADPRKPLERCPQIKFPTRSLAVSEKRGPMAPLSLGDWMISPASGTCRVVCRSSQR